MFNEKLWVFATNYEFYGKNFTGHQQETATQRVSHNMYVFMTCTIVLYLL